MFVTHHQVIFNEWKHLLEVDPHKHDVNAGKALQTRKEEAAQGRDWQDPCGEKEGEDRQQLTGSGWETNSFDLLEYLLHLVLAHEFTKHQLVLQRTSSFWQALTERVNNHKNKKGANNAHT